MFNFLVGVACSATVLAALSAVAVSGLRSGDRPGDAWVTPALADSGRPDEARPVVAAWVSNKSASAVLAGMTVRHARLWDRWPGGGFSVRVPRRTGRRRFRATSHDTVGVVPADATVPFTVPIPRATVAAALAATARGYAVTVAVGQREGRLRVYRLRVRGGGQPGPTVRAPLDLSGGTRRGQ
jgi:hypothetical protein